MASEHTIRVQILADGSALVNGVRRSREELDRLGVDLDKAGSAAKRSSKFFRGFSASLSGAAVAAFVAAPAVIPSAMSESENASARLEARLGITADAAARLNENAKSIYTGAWGDSLIDAADSFSTAAKSFGDVGTANLQALTENAYTVSGVFEGDVSGQIDAAKSLMENFGLSGEQAFDFVLTLTRTGAAFLAVSPTWQDRFCPLETAAGAECAVMAAVMS
ncbi:MAG: hypothetical protein GY862_09425 [Gammaproteobacteria bacterium]|nr:hypothetical protein [Gammaproteobacteria bacterium]